MVWLMPHNGWRLTFGSGCAALLVPPFFDLFDDLGAEGFKITGIARSDDALVDDDLSVLPFGARIRHVSLDRLVGRHLPALGDVGLDQQPRRMADGCHYFLGVEDVLDELERFWFDPQQVRVNLSAGSTTASYSEGDT